MKLFIVTLTLIVSLQMNTEVFAQSGTSAVMSVRVEILPSSQMEFNLNSDISDQISEGSENEASQDIRIGEITLRVPAEIEYSTHIDRRLKKIDGSSEWSMSSNMHPSPKNIDGAISYPLVASASDYLSSGFWQTEQIATVEYH